MVNFVAAPDNLAEEADKLAQKLANGPQHAYRYSKQNIHAAHNETMRETLDREALSHVGLSSGAEFREGVSAFLEKRRPNYGK